MHGEPVGPTVAVWAGALIGAAYKLAFPVGLRRPSLVSRFRRRHERQASSLRQAVENPQHDHHRKKPRSAEKLSRPVTRMAHTRRG
jgi:hypothetical protein